LWGWIKSALQRKPRYQDPAFRKFLRAYQRRVLLLGKRRALEEIYSQRGAALTRPERI
jgi:poly-beta-1,6-N-acetyl-D-glucosamine synthase